MKKLVLWLFIHLFRLLLSPPSVSAAVCTSTPVDNYEVTQDTTFVPDTYNLPNGISITVSNVLLDCNGSLLNGSRDRGGNAIAFSDLFNITIQNCLIENYFPADPNTEEVFAIFGERIKTRSSLLPLWSHTYGFSSFLLRKRFLM